MIERYNEGNINEVYRLKNEYVDLILRKSEFNNEFETYVLKKLQRYKLDIPLHIDSYTMGNEYVMIYKYIEGKTLQNISDNEINQIISFLLRLHSIKVTEDEINMKQPREDLKLMHQYIEKLKRSINKEEYRFICAEYEKLYKEHTNLEQLNKCFVHSDIKKENLLVNEKKVYVIDFGNCYIGSRLIDIARVIMWLFLYNENIIDFKGIERFCNQYFHVLKLDDLEYKMIPYILRFCLLYNYVKDKYLCSINVLPETYVNETSSKWLKILKDKNIIYEIVGIMRDERHS